MYLINHILIDVQLLRIYEIKNDLEYLLNYKYLCLFKKELLLKWRGSKLTRVLAYIYTYIHIIKSNTPYKIYNCPKIGATHASTLGPLQSMCSKLLNYFLNWRKNGENISGPSYL